MNKLSYAKDADLGEGVLRPGGPGDARICEKIVHAAYAKYIPRMEKPPSPLSYDYHEVLKAGFTYVYERGGVVVAMITLIPKEGFLLLRNLVVLPECQQQGIGRVFMEFAEAEARHRGLPAIHLWTNEAMWENVPYYQALGYAVQEKRTVDGYNRIFMSKSLPTSSSGQGHCQPPGGTMREKGERR